MKIPTSKLSAGRSTVAMACALSCMLLYVGACASTDSYGVDSFYDRAETLMEFNDVSVEGELTAPEGSFSRAGGAMAKRANYADDEPSMEPSADSESAPIEKPAPSVDEAKSTTTRLVIYRGSVGVLVANVDDARTRFLNSVTTLGGYLESQEDHEITVRVPATQFTAVVDGLVDYGNITHKSIDAVDVTKRVFELDVRIQNAERARERLLALLNDAREMKDILAIETELRRLTEEIEILKGEFRTLHDQISFSTLTVSFESNAPAPVLYGRRQSRFDWINRVGAEQVNHGF